MTEISSRPRPEIDIANLLALTRADYARLLTAARACVAAERDGLTDPLVFVRELLEDRGQLPPEGVRVPEVLAAVPVELKYVRRPVQRPAAVPPKARPSHQRLRRHRRLSRCRRSLRSARR